MIATGVLDGESVVVAEPAEANRLYNKGYFGTPETGNSLRLTLAEAIYCIQSDRLEIPDWDASGLLAHGGPGTQAASLAYGDLRERGLVVRPGDEGLTVWRRGDGPNKEPWFTTRPFMERTPVAADELADGPGVVSIVDEDSQVTHYQISHEAPQGDLLPTEFNPGAAILLGDHVYVDEPSLVEQLAVQHLGTAHGEGRMLSLVEAATLGSALTLSADFVAHATKTQPQFSRVQPVHEALRAAGVVTRSGFRFGTHLRGYASNPDEGHAPWLFHCVAADEPLAWANLSRGVRLAHGVRKQFVLAWGPEPVRFLAMEWFRP